MGQTEPIGKTMHREHVGFNKPHYQPLKNIQLKHTARRIQLFKTTEGTISKIHLPVQSKTVQTVVDIHRYYQTRAKLPNYKNIISLLQLQVIDSKGNNITQYLNQHGSIPNSSINVQFDAVCSLNIFQTHCRRSPLQKSSIKGELRLLHQFYNHNIQKQSENRRKSRQIYSQKQLWNILASCVQAANILGRHGLKQPLLSPIAIKLTPEGEIKVGEWDFTHYFEDANPAEQTNFHEEGQTMLYHTQETMFQGQSSQKQQFDILSCYYWPPEGTTSIQSSMGLGKLPGTKQNRGQVFSLGMTLLQLILQRTLYQKQTYSQKQLSRYLQEAASYRLRQGYPLSHLLTTLLSKMLVWESRQRISFEELQHELKGQQASPTYLPSSDRQSESVKQCTSNGFRTVQKRGPFGKEVQGSGIIDQGQGDETHPTAESMDKNSCSNRSRMDGSLDYHKLDYTIHRQRKQWQKFENRFMQSSYKLQPQLEIVKHSTLFSFPAEIMLEDNEDFPNQQALSLLQISTKEVQVCDEQEERPVDHSNCISDSIKILDLSNIRANEEDTIKEGWAPLHQANHETPSYNTKTLPHFKKNTPKQLLEEDSLLLKSSKSPQIAKFSHHLQTNNSVGSLHNQSVAHALNPNPNNNNEDLFTSPELMALIKSSARRHEEKENSYHNIKLQLSPSCVTSKVPVQMSQSTFVKEEFAKGWYEGGKMEGLRNGYGTFHYNEGGKYCGDWKQNLMHGRGTLYYSDGRIAYQGEWHCDKLHGNGILYNQNPAKLCNSFDYRNFEEAEEIWIYYEGGFANDDKCGKGILQLSNGQRFEGTFRNDVIEGKGKFFPLDGSVVSGEWSNNRLVRIQNVSKSSEMR